MTKHTSDERELGNFQKNGHCKTRTSGGTAVAVGAFDVHMATVGVKIKKKFCKL